jgi:pimeloyl-ACP methyl ester carboxylesterase
MTIEFLSLADCRLAYQRQVGNKNNFGILFLSGFASDMEGTKATFLSKQAAAYEQNFIRFDYRGCGRSEGDFSQGSIGRWFDDSLAVLDRLTEGPQIVVGSSMGGWLGLLLAKARPERFKAFIGVAAAPDFTEDLIWEKLTPAERKTLAQKGEVYENNTADKPITLTLIEEARKHLVLRAPLPVLCPVRLLQGMKDKDVPWQLAPRIAEHISCDDVKVTLIKNGDHSLSTPENLDMLWQTITSFI